MNGGHDVCVIGAGPAGLAAAIFAAEEGSRVAVLERNDRAGVKLLATGGGRCNAGNLRPAAEWPGLFGRRGRFIVPALRSLPTESLRRWFAELGQPLACVDGFHLFPESNSAKQLRDALLARALSLGVDIAYGRRADGLIVENGRVAGVRAGTEFVPCRSAVVATGGKSRPATGSTWDGCAMAETVGHRIAPPLPGLVGLRAANLDAALAGVILPRARVSLHAKGKAEEIGVGELLLTHGGISGPAALDLSASAAEGATLRIRWIEGKDKAAWLEDFAAWRKKNGGAALATLLREHLPLRLARWLCGFAGAAEATPASLAATIRESLAAALADFPLRIAGNEGWDKAMITRGGVDVRGINPETMESRIVGGLFFAGETVDMDGPCGGYNLHWAFASGALAGKNAAAGRLA